MLDVVTDFCEQTYKQYLEESLLEFQPFGRAAYLTDKNFKRRASVPFEKARQLKEMKLLSVVKAKRSATYYKAQE